MQEQISTSDDVYDDDGNLILKMCHENLEQTIDYYYNKSSNIIKNLKILLFYIQNNRDELDLDVNKYNELNDQVDEYVEEIDNIKNELEVYFGEGYCPWGDEFLSEMIKHQLTTMNYLKLNRTITDWFELDMLIDKYL